jgi:hypothetical protein
MSMERQSKARIIILKGFRIDEKKTHVMDDTVGDNGYNNLSRSGFFRQYKL